MAPCRVNMEDDSLVWFCAWLRNSRSWMKCGKGHYRGEGAIHSSIFQVFFSRWLLAILSAHHRNILNSQSHLVVKIPTKQPLWYKKRRSTLISHEIFPSGLSSDMGGGRHAEFSTVRTAFSFGDRTSKSIIRPASPALTKNWDHSHFIQHFLRHRLPSFFHFVTQNFGRKFGVNPSRFQVLWENCLHCSNWQSHHWSQILNIQ